MSVLVSTLGFPRIGPRRELKQALESHWSGKTTAAQLAAALRRRPLIAINCSRHTEAADFVGGFRPVR